MSNKYLGQENKSQAGQLADRAMFTPCHFTKFNTKKPPTDIDPTLNSKAQKKNEKLTCFEMFELLVSTLYLEHRMKF